MTPKEKAISLATGYYSNATDFIDSNNNAKEAAIVFATLTVEEILEIHENAADVFESEHDLNLNETSWNYWEEVKQELEKL